MSRVASQLQKLRAAIEGPSNPSMQGWKARGRPVIGYFCSYLPVEVLTALDVLPVRLRGAGSQDSASADVYLSGRTCTYVRHTLSLALEGGYDFLDGEICLNTCDHVRRAFDVWRHKTGVKFHGFVSVPRNVRESLYPYYREEIENLARGLEGIAGRRIEPEGLAEAIRKHNRVRERLRAVEVWRCRERPGLTGADTLTVSVAALVMAPDDFLEVADELVAALEDERPARPLPRARLLLAGNQLDEPGFVAAVESQDALVVADTLCFGSRSFERPVEEGAPDPLDAVCRRTFFQTSCARMIGNFPDRLDSLLALARERSVDGIVFQRLKFCDPWGGESHHLRARLKRLGIPFLFLEREYGRANTGQVKTRVQAFLEMIESGKRRSEPGQEGTA